MIKELAIGLTSLLLSSQTIIAREANRFDGTYSGDSWQDNGAVILTTDGCPPTQAGVFGQGLIAQGHTATFNIGAKPLNWPQLKPTSIVGTIASNGKFVAGTRMYRVDGQFLGPWDYPPPKKQFKGMLRIFLANDVTCTYSLSLVTSNTP
jgi:hypothetical protein